jgi:hypothetical protein
MTDLSPSEELRAAADKVAPASDTTPDLTAEYPDLEAAHAHLLRSVATEMDLAAGTEYRAKGDATDPITWQQALKSARQINGAS